MAQISPKAFSKDLAKQLFPDNVFYTKAMKDIAAGDVESVDIPIAGNIGSAKQGTPILPLTIGERTDDVKNYSLTQIWAEPILVKREEEIVLNYNKQLDIVRTQGEAMATRAANYAANAWGSTGGSSFVTLTTGTARATSLTGATGNRKAIAKADLLKVRNIFMKQNLRTLNGIIAVLTPDQYNDILGITEFVDFEKTGLVSKLEMGILGRILGFEVMVRWDADLGSIGLHYDATGANKKENGTVASTDAPAALFYHPDYVRYAEAYPETIINRKAPGYLGATIIESVVRFGATPSRNDGKGVVSLVEAT